MYKSIKEKIARSFGAGAFFLLFAFGFLSVAFAPQALAASIFDNNNSAANTGAGPNTSRNWAGYVATGTDYTSVSGSWVVPMVQASAGTSSDATWVGIGGVTGHDLIQTGTQAVSTNGQLSYIAWYELLPGTAQQVPLTVSAGNSVSASITETSPNLWLVSIRNNSTGQGYQTNVSYASSLSSAEWVEEMPLDASTNSLIPLDSFGTLNFTGATAVENGTFQTLLGTGAEQMVMVNSQNTGLAVPSAIGSDNESFTISRTSASAGTASANAFGSGYTTTGLGGSPRQHWTRTGVGVQGYIPRAQGDQTEIVRQAMGQNGFRVFGNRFGTISVRFEQL